MKAPLSLSKWVPIVELFHEGVVHVQFSINMVYLQFVIMSALPYLVSLQSEVFHDFGFKYFGPVHACVVVVVAFSCMLEFNIQ